jgi:hypothetical protein
MHDLRQRHCPIGTPTHCKERVATAWRTHHAAAWRFSSLGPQAHLPFINVKIAVHTALANTCDGP